MTLSSVLLVFALVAPCRSLVTVPRAVRRPSTVRLEAAPLLECKGIEAKVTEVNKQILKGLDLTVNAGEVHAIMGPNGASTNTASPRGARAAPPPRGDHPEARASPQVLANRRSPRSSRGTRPTRSWAGAPS